MAVIPLVPETKMADVGKLISPGKILVRKVIWIVLTLTSTTLILSRAFGADRLTRIAYISSRLPKIHPLTFWFPEITLSHSLLLHFNLQRLHTHTHTYTLSLSLSLSLFLSTSRNSLTLPLCKKLLNTRKMCAYTFCNHFFPVLPFRLDLFQPRTQPQKFHKIPKETNNQHVRRHVPPRIQCYISVYWYLA